MTLGVEAAKGTEPAARRVDSGGVGLHVLDWGGDGVPLVLLPGMGQSAHIFRTLAPALGPGFRVVAITPRAHGESDTPATGYTLAAFAADVRAVMDALGIERAAVAGHSIGGAVATRVAVDSPERVSHLVYIDALTDYASVSRVAARAPVRPPLLPADAGDKVARLWHRTFLYGVWNAAVEADWQARAASLEVRRHRHELLTDLLDDAVRTRHPFVAVECPVLALRADESVETLFPWLKPDDPRWADAEAYVHGVRAPWRRAAAVRFRRDARRGRVADVPGNHFFFLSAPERTAAEIHRFVLSPDPPMTQPMGYVDPTYLDAAARLVADGKRLSHARMRLAPGNAALDVGCGPGSDTLPLAELVGPGGRVEGIDHDAAMVAEADRRAADAGLSAFVRHHQGDAYALPFADATFDAARSERLFLHLAHPERAVAEMARVVRPGGRVVVMDTDWGTRSVDTPEVDLERRIARVLTETCLANGYSGRRLFGLMRDAGLAELEVDLVPLCVTDYELWRLLSRMEMAFEVALRDGVMTEEEARRLDASFREKDAAGTFFATTAVVMVSGTRA